MVEALENKWIYRDKDITFSSDGDNEVFLRKDVELAVKEMTKELLNSDLESFTGDNITDLIYKHFGEDFL